MKTWKGAATGYLNCWYGGRERRHHHVVWEKANGAIPEGFELDHINGKKDDNRLENLRLVSHKENLKNKARHRNNSSGVTGVGWKKSTGKWRAYVFVGDRQMSLGSYTDWFDAVCARKSADNRYGFHENHGRR